MGNRKKISLYESFDGRHNGLSTIRLLLASTVVLWHSFPLTGHDISPEGLREVVGSFRVDAFFAISGFLVLRTWNRNPTVRTYLRARAYRLLPAFWVNLIVTAFVIAPIATQVAGGDVIALFRGEHSAWRYVVQNSTTWVFFYDIDGTPNNVPFPGAWNGSIWMLKWEVAAYVGLLIIGITGVVRKRLLILSLAAAFWVLVLLNSVTELSPSNNFHEASRFGLMFSVGAALWAYSDKIKVDWRLSVISCLGILIGVWLPDYRLSAAPSLAYLVFWLAVHMKNAKFIRRNDYSYGIFLYSFPVQQLILCLGFPYRSPVLFFIFALTLTLPFAVASWHLVEKPIRARKRELDKRDALKRPFDLDSRISYRVG
ncbi:acyltransferase family protein [Rhodococcus sp. NPDC057529]|uniref:acyltransferase family protein n=1 Tax=Rhodococcus sp. NPDC057529 TaxID=3346158 RepID=UPI003671A0F6